jgi:pyruvate,water dikinase
VTLASPPAHDRSVEGLGEALVSGRATPERYVIERASGALVEGPAQPRVDAPTLAAVAELARRAEAAFGAPQDVEWAVAGDGVALLQARPITVEAEAPDARIRLLTRANVGEVLPGPVTPLTESTVLAFLEHGFREVAGQAGLLPPDATRFLVLQRRRLYLNLSLCVEVMARLPGVSASDAERLILGGGATRGFARRLGLRAALGLLGVGARLARTAARLPAAVRRAEDAVAGLCPAEEIASAGPDRLAALLREAQVAGRLIGTTHIAVSGAAAFRLAVLGRLVGGEGDDAAARVNRLVSGPRRRRERRSTLALEALVRAGAGAANGRRGAAARRAPRACSGEVPLRLAAEPQAFLRRYGHRAVSEGELGRPPGRTTHAGAAGAAGSLKAPRSADFTPGVGRGARADEDALLARAGRYAVLCCGRRSGRAARVRERERRSLAIALVHHLRRLARAGGRWLAHAGTLAREDDVLFLTLDSWRPCWRAPRCRRRSRAGAAVSSAGGASAPRELDLADPDGALAGGDGPLAGVGVSAGVGAGPARVAAPRRLCRAWRGDRCARARRGSRAAAGDLGGGRGRDRRHASHGSVVARELGVPCVVDVRDATRRIRTGDQVLQTAAPAA